MSQGLLEGLGVDAEGLAALLDGVGLDAQAAGAKVLELVIVELDNAGLVGSGLVPDLVGALAGLSENGRRQDVAAAQFLDEALALDVEHDRALVKALVVRDILDRLPRPFRGRRARDSHAIKFASYRLKTPLLS